MSNRLFNYKLTRLALAKFAAVYKQHTPVSNRMLEARDEQLLKNMAPRVPAKKRTSLNFVHRGAGILGLTGQGFLLVKHEIISDPSFVFETCADRSRLCITFVEQSNHTDFCTVLARLWKHRGGCNFK